MKKLQLVIFFLILSISTLSAKPDFSSPFKTVSYCNEAVKEDSTAHVKLAEAFAGDMSQKKKVKLAKRFIQLLEVNTLFFEPRKAPKKENFVDSTYDEHVYYPFELNDIVYIEKVGNQWLISEETVNSIDEWYENSTIIKATRFHAKLPQGEFLGLKTWQWLGLLVYLLIALLMYKILIGVIRNILKKIFYRYSQERIFETYINPVTKPMSIALVLGLMLLLLGLLHLPLKLSYFLTYALKISILVFVTVTVFRASNILGAILAKLAARTESTVDDQLIPLLIKLLKVVVVVLGGIYIVKALGWSITPLLAGASIGGIAIAMSAQDTIKNLFGSFTMFTDQPFEVGDWIVFSGGEGMVEEVGIRSTRIRTFYDSLISVPNGQLANAVIDNMGRRTYRRFFTKIGVTYDTHPDAIDAFVEGLRGLVVSRDDTRDYFQVHLNGFGASSIEILFYIFFTADDWTGELEARHQIISDIIRLADSLGVRFAFNTQTVHIENMPGAGSLTPQFDETPESLAAKRKDFMKLRDKSGK